MKILCGAGLLMKKVRKLLSTFQPPSQMYQGPFLSWYLSRWTRKNCKFCQFPLVAISFLLSFLILILLIYFFSVAAEVLIFRKNVTGISMICKTGISMTCKLGISMTCDLARVKSICSKFRVCGLRRQVVGVCYGTRGLDPCLVVAAATVVAAVVVEQ